MSIRHSFLAAPRNPNRRTSLPSPAEIHRTMVEPLEHRIAPAAVLTSTMVDTWNDADGDGKVEPGEIISYEVVITNTGDMVTTNGVRFEDILEANLTLVNGSLNVSPLALDDAYTAVRNTQLQVGTVTGAPNGPQLFVSGSLFDNDREFLSDTFTLSTIGSTPFTGTTTTITLASGSTVTIDADGNFTYLPVAGFAGASETFTYTIRDDGTDGIAGNADDLSSVGTVTVNLAAQEVWYVDSSYAGANGSPNGTSYRPFTALSSVTGATGPDGAGDIIYVAVGAGAYNANMTLLNQQKLIGGAEELVIAGVGTLRPAGARTVINNTTGDAVTIAATSESRQSVEVRGFSLQGSVNALDVTSSGSNAVGVTIANNIFAGAGQEAVDLNAGAAAAFAVTFTNNGVAASTGNAFDARTSNAGAAMTLTISDNTITSAASGIVVDGTAGGTITIAGFANNTISGDTGAVGVSINTATFDAATGAAYDQVIGGTLSIGTSGNGVGTSGLVLTNVRGDVTFTDLDVYASAGTALFATTGAAFVANPGAGFRLVVTGSTPTFDANGGPAIDANTTLLTLPSATIRSVNSTTFGLNLNNVDGSAITALAASSISGLSGAGSVAFRVVESAATVTFNGTISTSAGSGVVLQNNSGGTIAFGGALTLSTGTNAAFSATGGGTVTATGTGSTLTTTTGIALNVLGTTIGAANLNFRSISSNGGGSPGIVLDNTGTSGGLIVTGNGAAGTGGTIQGKLGNGITLNNTRGVSLSFMTIDNNDGSGVHGTNVTNFSLISSTVSNNGDVADGSEAGLRFNGLFGTSAITNSTFAGQVEDHVRITNSSGTLTNLTVSGSTFNANSAATGGHGISMINTGTATATITVNTTNFTGIRSSAILVNGANTTVSGLNVTGGTFTDIGSAVTVQSSDSADLNFNVSGITSIRSISNAIQLVAGSTSTPSSNIVGVINNNTIGNGTVDSGSRDLYGIAIDLRGDQDSILSITNNTIRNTDINGIFVSSADFGSVAGPSARMDLHLRDNSVTQIDDNSAFPFTAVYGVLVDVRHTTTAYLDISGNNSTGLGGLEHFRFRQRDTAQVFVERLTDGDGTPGELINNVAALEAFFTGQNDAGSTTDVTITSGMIEAADGAARDPLLFFPTSEPVVVNPPSNELPEEDPGTTPVLPEQPETPPVLVPETPDSGIDDGLLSQGELDTLVSAAIARWAASGLSAEQLALLESVTFVIDDLSGWNLGMASGTTVTMDRDAAGNTWFVDATPMDDIEFAGSGSRLTATINGGASGRVDALTTIMHELGHVLGLEDSYASSDRDDLMFGFIGAGERRLADAGAALGATADDHDHEPVAFIGAPIVIGDLPAGKSVTIRFQATVNPAILVNQVSNQGFIRDNGGALLSTTDDPSVAGSANPTVTEVDLPDVTLAVSPASAAEDGSGNLVYTFTRTGSTAHPITVNFGVSGTAASASDYGLSGTNLTFNGTIGSIVIPAGSATATITLSPTDDTVVEADETAILTVLAGPVGAPGYDVGTPSAATGTITNDDTDVSVTVSPGSVTEDGAGNLVYTFTRTGVTTGTLVANFATTGTASLFNSDFTQSFVPGTIGFDPGTGLGTVTFGPGVTSVTLTVDPTADNTVEADETRTVTVTTGTGYNVAGTPATGTILNDDTDVTLAVEPASVTEDGAGNLVYTFTRSGFVTNALTVNFNVGGTSTFNDDYSQSGAASFSASSGTVTFAAGATTATITIDPTADTLVESDETFSITLTSGSGYTAVTSGAVSSTIRNDDTDVTMSISPASVAEDGTGTLVYTFTRTGVTDTELLVNFSVGGTATFATDYSQTGAESFTASSGTVRFLAGATIATVTIAATDDLTVEADETTILSLLAGTGYLPKTEGGVTGTILNDDTEVSVAVSPAAVAEDSGSGLVYTFTRNGVLSTALTVNFSVGGAAAFGVDYTQAGAGSFNSTTGTVTFAPGASTATVTLTPTADSTVEADETAILTVTSGGSYTLAAPTTATGTITNDDAEVTLAVSPSSVLEDGAANLVYTFTRTGATTGALTVNFSIGGSATFNNDYTQSGAATFGVESGSVTFLPGATTATVTIDPTADTNGEVDETVALTLSTGSGYTSGTPSAATGTILNDDTFVSVTLEPETVSEGGPGTLVYTFTRTGDTSTALVVNFGVSGSATFTTDYTVAGGTTFNATTGTITIPIGSASASITLTPVNDTIVEGEELVDLTVTGGSGYTVDEESFATGAILDNDTALVRLTSASSTVGEGAGSQNIGVELIVTANGVVGTGSLGREVSVNLNTLQTGTAGEGDYTFSSPQTVTFIAGQTSTTTNVAVGIVNDALVEGDEVLNFTLDSLIDGTEGGVDLGAIVTHALTIDDNDTATIGLVSGASTVGEDGVPQIQVGLVINADGTGTAALARPVSLTLATTGGTATSGADYSFSNPQVITFNTGAVAGTQTVAITLVNDTLVEGTETVIFGAGSLQDGTAGQVTQTGATAHTLSITDNDTATIQFALDSNTFGEGDGAQAVSLVLVITGNGEVGVGSLAQPISVNVATTGGTATGGGSDYSFTSPSVVTFAAESTSGNQSAAFTLINDERVEGAETIVFGLGSLNDPTGQATLGNRTTHTANITDNDTATIALVSNSSTAGEDAGTVNVGLVLTITANGVVGTGTLERNLSVDVRDLLTGTAVAGGVDYTFATPQTVTFASGEVGGTKNVTLTLNNDTLLESAEGVNLVVENFTDGTGGQASFTGSANHTVNITDNEFAVVTFVTSESDANEAAGTHQVGVRLEITGNGVAGTGTLSNSVFVNLLDLGTGTAIGGGTDYATAQSINVEFATGESSGTKFVPITIVDDALSEGDETIELSLAKLEVGAGAVSNGTPNTHTVTIVDNDIDLEVTKVGSVSTVVAGSGVGNLTYTITLRNVGATVATGVILAEDLTFPAGVTLVSVTPSQGSFAGTVDGDGAWNVGTLGVEDSVTLTVVLTVDASAPEGSGLISNTASVSASNEVRINPTDDSATVATNIDRQVDLSVNKTDGLTTVVPGDSLNYTITYANAGLSNATGVVLTEILPAGTTFNAANSTAGWQETATPGVYTLTLGTVAAGGNGTATFAVNVNTPAAAGQETVVNSASIADDGSAGSDLVPGDNTAGDTNTLEAAPDLNVTITDDPLVAQRGGVVRYTVEYSNTGNQDATGAFITMTLPENTFFNGFESTGIWSEISTGVFRLDLGNLGAGDEPGSHIFAVTVNQALPGGYNVLSTTGTIGDDAANGEDPNVANNTDTEQTPLYQGIYAVSPGVALPKKGAPPAVRVFDIASGAEIHTINAYDPSYRDSVRIAVGDINGDGFDDIITATRKGSGSVRVFDGVTGARFEGPFAEIAAFTEKGARGAFVASGDVTGDGRDDIIVGSGQGARGAGKVRVFDGVTGQQVATFQPFTNGFHGGVRVAVGDVNGDGLADIISSQGVGGNDVKVTSGVSTTVLHDLDIGGRNYRGGVFVATGDINGDGSSELIVGRDRGQTVIETFSGSTGELLSTIVPFATNYRLGVRVAAADVNLDGVVDIIAGAGGRANSEVKIFDGSTTNLIRSFQAFPEYPTGALFVAGTTPVPVVGGRGGSDA